MRHLLGSCLALIAVGGCHAPAAPAAPAGGTSSASPATPAAGDASAARPSPSSAGPRLEPRWALPPRRIAGRVTLDGQPTTAVVQFADLDGQLRVTTGADGRFDLGSRTDPQPTLVATAPGASPFLLELVATERPSDDLELRLSSCLRRVSGTVRDDRGPVAGAVIGLGPDALPIATTDGAGAYQLCVADSDFQVTVRAPGHGAVLLDELVIGDRVFDVTLAAAAAPIHGRIVDGDGRPLAGAPISVLRDDDVQWVEATAVSDDAGRFRFDSLGRGEAFFLVDAAWTSARNLVSVPVASRDLGGPVADVVLRADHGTEWTGQVVSAGGAIAGALIQWHGPDDQIAVAMTDSGGRFTLPAAGAGGTFEIYGHVVAHVDEDAEAQQLTLRVSPVRAVAGVVLHAGRPVANAVVNSIGGDDHTISRADGRFLLLVDDASTIEIQAGSDDVRAFGLATVQVGDGTTADVVIELGFAGSVAGIVVDQRGDPVVGATVSLANATATDFGGATTGADGRFTVIRLSGGPAPYKVSVTRSSKEVPAKVTLAPATAFPVLSLADGDTHLTGIKLVVKNNSGLAAPMKALKDRR